MAGISSTGGATLPTAQQLFASSTGTAPAPSTTPVPGPVVSGPGGTTQLPDAAPADFAGSDPTALDQPHPQYPALIVSHVAVLQAIGTPEAVIQQLAATRPQAEFLDRYIRGEIMQNPEGWDQYVGNPNGTARAGLQQLMPGHALPAPGQGNAGYLSDGSPVSGIDVPGVSTPVTSGPMLDPTTGKPEGSGLLWGIVGAIAVVGAGLLAWKFMSGRNAMKETERAANMVMQGNGGIDQLRSLVGGIDFGKLKGKELVDIQRALSLNAMAGGAGALTNDIAGLAASSQRAAGMHALLGNLGPVDGFVMQATAGAVAMNAPVKDVAKMMLDNRKLGILEQAVRNGGGLGDLALANITGMQLAGAAANGAGDAARLAGTTQLLEGILNTLR